MTTTLNVCINCKLLQDSVKRTCPVYPNGIPEEIFYDPMQKCDEFKQIKKLEK